MSLKRLSLRQLDVFRTLMNSRTATEAADALNMTQPGVSKTLTQLEDQLGLRLFERIKGRLYATPEATTLYPEVDKIFGAVESMVRLAEDMRDVKSGIISVAAIPTLANVFLSKVIVRLREELPNVRVSMQVLPTVRIIDEVVHGHVDLGFIHDVADVPTVRSEDLDPYDVVAILPADHPLKDRDVISFDDLEAYPVVSFPVTSPFGSRIRQVFQQANREYRVAIDVGASSSLSALVESGAGIGIIEPAALFGELPRDLVVKPLEAAIPIRPRILFPLYRPLSMIAKKFVELYTDVVDEETRRHAAMINPVAGDGAAGDAAPGP